MASPLFDALSVSLSRMIEDPVSSATTDGDAITSAMRSQFLNEGIRRCIKRWVAQGNQDAIREYINTESQTLASSTKALSSWTGGVFAILAARNTTDTAIPIPLSNQLVAEATSGVNRWLLASSSNQKYYLNGGNFVLLGGTATSAISLTYVKQHTDLVAGGSAGTVVFDNAWTASSTTITNFTGVLSTHVTGKFVGTDNGGNYFERTIATYVSATSFTINSALVADGAGTAGYIVPPTANDIIIPSQYWPEVLDEAYLVWAAQNPGNDSTLKMQMIRGAKG
jgi:hypothetical protein